MEMRVWDSTHKHILLCVSVAFVVSGTSALDLYTPSELYVLNGTTATLRCTFKSSELVNSMTSVEWFYQAEGDTQNPTSIFYFINGMSFPTGTLFKARAEWAGDINRRDASIRLLRMQFTDNGTFFCNVKVPPDMSSRNAGTRLWVVESLPQTSTAVIVGGVISAVFGILILSLVLYFLFRRQEPDHHYEGCTSLESVSSQNTRPGKKAESSADNSRCPSPSAPVQGPVIYAQLDYSGTKNSSFHKMEPVVYADIRKN